MIYEFYSFPSPINNEKMLWLIALDITKYLVNDEVGDNPKIPSAKTRFFYSEIAIKGTEL